MPGSSEVRQRGDVRFHFEGTVRGLRSEAARIEERFESLRPTAVALGIGPEDLAGLRAFRDDAAYEHEYSEADEVYEQFLGQFGEVALPPPDLLAAVRAAERLSIPLVAIDLPEVEYVRIFTSEVTGWSLVRYNLRVRRLARRPPRATDALDFHLRWDEELRKVPGFGAVEAAREQAMARTLRSHAFSAGDVLVVLEAARLRGLMAALDRQAPELGTIADRAPASPVAFR